MAYIISLFIILFSVQVATAEPTNISVAGNATHGSSLVISGSSFGTKTNAKPLMWDDGENQSDGDLPISSENSASRVGYTDYWPKDTHGGDAVPEAWRIKYRAIPHTPVSAAVAGPHSKSTVYMSGGHYSGGGAAFVDAVGATVGTGGAYADRWYATFYYRLNTEWPSCGNSPNHKYTAFREGQISSDNWWYMNFNNSNCPCTHTDVRTRSASKDPLCVAENLYLPSGGLTAPWDNLYENTPYTKNPYSGWIRVEQIISNDQGFMYVYHDNELVWQGGGEPNFITGSTGYDLGWSGIGSFSIGGYYRYNDGSSHDDAFRFFDDVYVDNSLSRVMLANNGTYASATIIEPQPVVEWATGEITVTVNQGALPNGTAYLFVFDSDNDANATGYPVTLSDTTPSASGITFSGVTIGQ
jgi:hypothetical protein